MNDEVRAVVFRSSFIVHTSSFNFLRLCGECSVVLSSPHAEVNQAVIAIRRTLIEEMFARASEARPEECCGLVGGVGMATRSVYPLRNVARDPSNAYEGAPQELFDAQRLMRERGEKLVAIYHSHPRANDPVPSESDVRAAYYPTAVHFIIGLAGDEPTLRAFRLFEGEGRWERVEYEIAEE
jgi:proteasome lid subunit RPN8/RPN11